MAFLTPSRLAPQGISGFLTPSHTCRETKSLPAQGISHSHTFYLNIDIYRESQPSFFLFLCL